MGDGRRQKTKPAKRTLPIHSCPTLTPQPPSPASGLRRLDLSHNALETLPAEVLALVNLELLNLYVWRNARLICEPAHPLVERTRLISHSPPPFLPRASKLCKV